MPNQGQIPISGEERLAALNGLDEQYSMNKVVVKLKDGRADIVIRGVITINSVMGRTLLIRAFGGRPLRFTHDEIDEIRWVFNDEKNRDVHSDSTILSVMGDVI